jgi:Na+/melibiose symporter-like transporter
VTERGVSLGILGIILLLVRIVDAIQDPLIGGLSDHFASLRKWIIAGGVLILAIGMMALFAPPVQSGAGWFAFWVIVSASAFSLISINLNTLGGIWSRDHHERTRIAGVRERFGLAGVSLGVIVPGILILQMPKSAAFAWFIAGLCILLIMSSWWFYLWAEAHPELFEYTSKRWGANFQFRYPTDSRIRRLLWITLFGTLASSLPAVLFLFFVRDRLQAEQWAWLYLVIYFVAAILGIPFWRELSKSNGKVKVWCYTMLLATVSFTGALLVSELDYVLYGLVCIATGFALGGDLVFPSSLMADYVGESEESLEWASTNYAWLSFIQKSSFGLAAGLAFPALDAVGFESGAVNSRGAVMALVILYAGIPLVLKLMTVLLAWRSGYLLEGELINEKTNNRRGRRDTGDGADTEWMQKSYEN